MCTSEVLGAPAGAAAVAGALFAAHPVHVEAVASIVGRAELMACGLLLLSALAYARLAGCRAGLACAVCLAALALLCKETAAAALPLCAALELARAAEARAGEREKGSSGVPARCLSRLLQVAAATAALFAGRLALNGVI